MPRPALLTLLLSTALLVLPRPLAAQDGNLLEHIWVVHEYDPARDPAADLETAVTRAEAEGKQILLEVGGEWCGWCKRLDLFIHEHPAVAEGLAEGFVVVQVNMSQENDNEAFLSRYPRIPGYPHIFVLDSDGTFLHSQDTADLEEGSSYNEGAILEFLQAWAPEGTALSIQKRS